MTKRKVSAPVVLSVALLAKLVWDQQTKIEVEVRETLENNRAGSSKRFGWFNYEKSTPALRRKYVESHAAQAMAHAGLWRGAIDQCKASGLVSAKCEIRTAAAGVAKGSSTTKRNWLPNEWAMQSTGVDYLRQPAGWKILEWWKQEVLATMQD